MADSDFTRPPLADLINRLRTDLLSRLDLFDELRRADAEVYARVLAEGINGLYGYLDWQAKQYLPDLAGQDGVERWADMLGEWYAQATAASGSVPVIGTIGASIPDSARWQSAGGVLYRPVDPVVLAASPQNVPIVCEATGQAGNLGAGETLSLISPVPGVQSQTVVPAEGIAGGADQETVEGLRVRVLRRLSLPPQGGSATDYESWALAAHPAVTRAWVAPMEQGAGTVVVRVVCEGEVDPIPTGPVLVAVADHIEVLRPVTAEVFVVAPEARPVDFSIQLLPDTPTIRARVTSGLQDLLRREAEPGGTILRTHLAEAISISDGEHDHVLTVPAADVVSAAGEFPVMGVITWL